MTSGTPGTSAAIFFSGSTPRRGRAARRRRGRARRARTRGARRPAAARDVELLLVRAPRLLGEGDVGARVLRGHEDRDRRRVLRRHERLHHHGRDVVQSVDCGGVRRERGDERRRAGILLVGDARDELVDRVRVREQDADARGRRACARRRRSRCCAAVPSRLRRRIEPTSAMTRATMRWRPLPTRTAPPKRCHTPHCRRSRSTIGHVVDPHRDRALHGDQQIAVGGRVEERLDVEDAVLGLLRARGHAAMTLGLEDVRDGPALRLLRPRRRPRRALGGEAATALGGGAASERTGDAHVPRAAHAARDERVVGVAGHLGLVEGLGGRPLVQLGERAPADVTGRVDERKQRRRVAPARGSRRCRADPRDGATRTTPRAARRGRRSSSRRRARRRTAAQPCAARRGPRRRGRRRSMRRAPLSFA